MFSRINKLFFVCIALVLFVGVFQVIADPEANKAAIHRDFDEVWNQGSVDVADEIFAANWVNHDLGHPEVTDTKSYKGWVLRTCD